jgi:tRNA(adenine34) deaminase
MHYLDEGPSDRSMVHLFLHPTPGWSYSLRAQIQALLQQGAHVVAPDLIGFGKSDKPKREEFHSPELHLQSVLDLIERLDLNDITLVAPQDTHWLMQRMVRQVGLRFAQVQILPVKMPGDSASKQAEFDAPFPDAGHRAATRACAAMGWRSPRIQA